MHLRNRAYGLRLLASFVKRATLPCVDLFLIGYHVGKVSLERSWAKLMVAAFGTMSAGHALCIAYEASSANLSL